MQTNLRYLRAVGRQFGPLSKLASDKQTSHLLLTTRGVLTRVIAEMDLAEARLVELRLACAAWSDTLRRLEDNSGAYANAADALAHLRLDAAVSAEQINATLAALMKQLASDPASAARGLMAAIVGDESRYRQRLEDRCAELRSETAAVQGSAPGDLSSAQREQLLDMLRQIDPGMNLRIAEVSAVPGGYSKQTIMVDLENTRVLPRQIVLRHDRPESPVDTSVTIEYPLLQVLFEAGVKVPRPMLLDHEGTVVGAPLMVVGRVGGAIVADGHHFHQSTANRTSWAKSLAEEMAKLHAIDPSRLPSSLPGQSISNAAMLRAELDDFRRIWAQYPNPDVAVEAAFEWLYQHLSDIDDAKSVTHGDLRFHNMLVDDNGVAAILDWELVKVQHPALDLAYCYHHVRQLMDWGAFLDCYRAAGGTIPSPQVLSFFILRSEMLVSTMLTKIELGFLTGTHDMIDLAYAGTQLRQYSLHLLSQRLDMVLNSKPF